MSDKKHHDASWLREQYYEQKQSVPEIAERCDVVAQTIYDAMDRHGIERDATRYGDNSRVAYATYYVDDQGYPRWQSKGRSGGERVTYNYHIHRLTAIAEYGIEAVKGKEVHHRNDLPWDNRPENLKPMSVKEHNEEHLSLEPADRLAAALIWDASELSSDDVAELFGVSGSTVRRYHQRELAN